MDGQGCVWTVLLGVQSACVAKNPLASLHYQVVDTAAVLRVQSWEK